PCAETYRRSSAAHEDLVHSAGRNLRSLREPRGGPCAGGGGLAFSFHPRARISLQCPLPLWERAAQNFNTEDWVRGQKPLTQQSMLTFLRCPLPQEERANTASTGASQRRHHAMEIGRALIRVDHLQQCGLGKRVPDKLIGQRQTAR